MYTLSEAPRAVFPYERTRCSVKNTKQMYCRKATYCFFSFFSFPFPLPLIVSPDRVCSKFQPPGCNIMKHVWNNYSLTLIHYPELNSSYPEQSRTRKITNSKTRLLYTYTRYPELAVILNSQVNIAYFQHTSVTLNSPLPWTRQKSTNQFKHTKQAYPQHTSVTLKSPLSSRIKKNIPTRYCLPSTYKCYPELAVTLNSSEVDKSIQTYQLNIAYPQHTSVTLKSPLSSSIKKNIPTRYCLHTNSIPSTYKRYPELAVTLNSPNLDD